VAVTNILCQTKRWFAFSEVGFCAGTKVFEEALNAVKFLGWLKKFGSAQNFLGPVKGQGITIFEKRIHIWFKQKCSDFHQSMQNAILCPTFNKKCNKCTMFIEGGSLIL
jgi:hypothetical protein